MHPKHFARDCGRVLPPWGEKVVRRQKELLQRKATQAIKNLERPDPVHRIRKKLSRWFDPECKGPNDMVSPSMLIPGPPNWIAGRAHGNLLRLQGLAPPRVCAAVLRVLWNSWCTARRFQNRFSSKDRCLLGCKGAHDSIEHYSRCPVGREILRKILRVDLQPQRGLAMFTLSTPEQSIDALLAVSAVYIYSIYCTTNGYRHTAQPNIPQAKQCMIQHIRQACFGHPTLSHIVENRWREQVYFV